jgi:tRNA(Ile)-lysidine synthase
MRPDPAVAASRRAVRESLAGVPAGPVVVACSGGADSLALLAAAAHLSKRLGRAVDAVTVDHALQPGSGEQAQRVLEQAAALAVPGEVVRVSVGRAGGPEAAARTARYAALEAAARRTGAVAVLLGHTRDDQAETVLLGLARGSGARSLAGMAPMSGLYVRPFLGLDRATTAKACAAQGLVPWDDPHNADPAYTRVRVRTTALPALTTALGPGVPEALARTADLLRADADALDEWANRARAEAADDAGGLDVARLAGLPQAVRTRVLRTHAIEAGSPGGALTAGHVAAMDALVTGWKGQGPVSLPGSLALSRSYGSLRITPARPTATDPGDEETLA